jgi:hypothetical protein
LWDLIKTLHAKGIRLVWTVRSLCTENRLADPVFALDAGASASARKIGGTFGRFAPQLSHASDGRSRPKADFGSCLAATSAYEPIERHSSPLQARITNSGPIAKEAPER